MADQFAGGLMPFMMNAQAQQAPLPQFQAPPPQQLNGATSEQLMRALLSLRHGLLAQQKRDASPDATLLDKDRERATQDAIRSGDYNGAGDFAPFMPQRGP